MRHHSDITDVRSLAGAFVMTFAAALLFIVPTPSFAASVCPADSTQGSCACPTSGPGVTCVGGQLYNPDSQSCYDDVRPCASNQVMDCNTGSCECNTTLYPCGGCTAATSTPGGACSSPINGAYTNQCGACGCPSGTQLCSSSNTCVAVKSCAPGLTFDPCTGQCSTPYVLRSPSATQQGYIDVDSDITAGGDLNADGNTHTGGDLTADGNIHTGGDLTFASGKSIRVDGSGVTSLYFGNWAAGATGVQFRIYGDADANRLCLSGDCISSWDEVGTPSGTPDRVAAFDGNGDLGAATQLYTDATGTNLGIRAVPNYPLHVNGHAYVTGDLGVGTVPTTSYGVHATSGSAAAGYFESSGSTGKGYAGYGTYGLYGTGTRGVYGTGSEYGVFGQDSDAGDTGSAYVGFGDYGIYTVGSVYGVRSIGSSYGVYGGDSNDSSYGYLGYGATGVTGAGTYGVKGTGSSYGVYGNNSASSGYGYLGNGATGVYGGGTYGVNGTGSSYGVHGVDSDNTGYGYVGIGDTGVTGYGNSAGGYFQERDTGAFAYLGYLGYGTYGSGVYGVRGSGTTYGVYGNDTDNSGYGYLGNGDYGVTGYGNYAGAYFNERDTGTYSYVARGSYGIDAGGGAYGVKGRGSSWGLYGGDSNSSGYGYVGVGDAGVTGYGNYSGGYFKETDTNASVYLGRNNYSVYASGGGYGAYATGTAYGLYGGDSNSSGYGFIGYGDYGTSGYGNYAGGYFKELDTGAYAYLGYSNYGVYTNGGAYGTYSKGTSYGVYGGDSNSSGYGFIGYGDYGTSGYGNYAAGYFSELDTGAYAYLGYSGYSLYTNNAVRVGGALTVSGTSTLYNTLYARDVSISTGYGLTLGGVRRTSWPSFPTLNVTTVTGSVATSASSTNISWKTAYIYCPDSSYRAVGTGYYVAGSCNDYYKPCGTGGFSYIGSYYAQMRVAAYKQSSGTGYSSATLYGTLVCAKLQ